MTIRDPAAEWESFCEQLKNAGKALFRADRPDDALTDAEGLRHLARLSRIALERSLEHVDSQFPTIFQIVDETRKFGCDNPDTIYQVAKLDGRGSYRLSGTRGTVDYLSFTTSSGSHAKEGAVTQTGFLDNKALAVGPDGQFEIILSATQPASGNWLAMTQATSNLSIRQTFLDRRREVRADLTITRLGQSAVPAPIDYAGTVSALGEAHGFVHYCATLFPDWTHSYLGHINALPSADQEACLRAGGDPNIYFYRSVWSLAEDEALVIRIPRLPECESWNLQVDNFWQESMDYRYFRSHINKHIAHYEPDGSVIAIIAHRDPGKPNWLDTAHHRIGHFAMRYIRANEHIDPETRLCTFDTIDAAIAELSAD
ncbi:DUF1214 domain-containing protein (plasmid) [Sphingomonas paeninsulae]|uniref:DUF1214 domain-containing protein n=1 Tax=Sphingomonas paeninsulae TaxID=2319844 RepID=A0A494TIK6_SPHPE|nr:DUF1214 domain-containing protein [Sphingomonas paeninsulae]AYJ85258.1 DUF1214 domain-containing protein [Sphingomonas paeninsulae]